MLLVICSCSPFVRFVSFRGCSILFVSFRFSCTCAHVIHHCISCRRVYVYVCHITSHASLISRSIRSFVDPNRMQHHIVCTPFVLSIPLLPCHFRTDRSIYIDIPSSIPFLSVHVHACTCDSWCHTCTCCYVSDHHHVCDSVMLSIY